MLSSAARRLLESVGRKKHLCSCEPQLGHREVGANSAVSASSLTRWKVEDVQYPAFGAV